MPDLIDSPQDMLCFALYSADHAMTRLYRKHLDPLGLTYPQYLVLLALGDPDPITVRQLGTMVALESNTLTPLLKRMESNGLLTRRRNPQDERALQVALTDKGRALRTRIADIQACVISASGLSIDDLKRLRDDIITLRRNLEQAA